MNNSRKAQADIVKTVVTIILGAIIIGAFAVQGYKIIGTGQDDYANDTMEYEALNDSKNNVSDAQDLFTDSIPILGTVILIGLILVLWYKFRTAM